MYVCEVRILHCIYSMVFFFYLPLLIQSLKSLVKSTGWVVLLSEASAQSAAAHHMIRYN